MNAIEYGGGERRRGMTLIEIMAVLVIITVVMVSMGMAYTKHITKANRDETNNELSVFSNNLGDAYYDLGFPSFDPATAEGRTKFEDFLDTLQSSYIGCVFDKTSIKVTDAGFTVEISSPMSVYESRYKCWFETKDGTERLIMIACACDDGQFSSDTYGQRDADGKYTGFGDDIVLVVKPKTI